MGNKADDTDRREAQDDGFGARLGSQAKKSPAESTHLSRSQYQYCSFEAESGVARQVSIVKMFPCGACSRNMSCDPISISDGKYQL